jgi:uncharacterized protein YifE (UPF0438 family)
MRLNDKDFLEPFDLRLKNTEDKFTLEERKLLLKRGRWFWGLMCGTACAIHSDDKHFVEVFRDKLSEPNNETEYLWKKYLSALEEEKELEELRLEEAKNSEKYKRHASRIVP